MHPSTVLALALSMAVSVVTARWAMPPMEPTETGPRFTAEETGCVGYFELHLLLKSMREAREFMERDNCGDAIVRAIAISQ
jgi:hypothetical protein